MSDVAINMLYAWDLRLHTDIINVLWGIILLLGKSNIILTDPTLYFKCHRKTAKHHNIKFPIQYLEIYGQSIDHRDGLWLIHRP